MRVDRARARSPRVDRRLLGPQARPDVHARPTPPRAWPIDRELLAEIVACRLPVRDMADVMDRSPATIRYWLARHEITPPASARRRPGARATSTHPGKCALCGYDRCLSALQFHHVDPGAKGFAISRGGVARAIAKARAEAAECVLLCANCHAEVESGFAQLPLP